MTTPQMPAGWYTDPDGSGGQRYWNGYSWTEHQSPAPQAPPPPPPPQPEPSEPARAPRSGGAHRAPEDSADATEPGGARSPADAASAIPMSPVSPPAASAPPDGPGGDDRQLLVRYLAVCGVLLGVLVAVSVYAAFFSNDDTTSVGAFDDPATTMFPTMTPTATADGGWGETPPDTATETTTVTPTFPENSDATDGGLAFSVDTVEVTPSVSSLEFPVDKTATGEYVVVHMTVTNTSDESTTFLGTFQKLMADGSVYSIDDEATFFAGGALAELGPGDQAEVAVVFDVPPGTDPEVIELHAGPLSPGVEVSLP